MLQNKSTAYLAWTTAAALTSHPEVAFSLIVLLALGNVGFSLPPGSLTSYRALPRAQPVLIFVLLLMRVLLFFEQLMTPR
jgi:hypothetical protein